MNIDIGSKQLFKTGFIILCSLVLINIAILDIWILSQGKSESKNTISKSIAEPKNSSETKPTTTVELCPASCLAAIDNVKASIKTVQSKALQEPTAAASSVPASKEFVIPFGSGVSATDEWADVQGLQTYIDSAKYGQIGKVVFEASVRIPTGNQVAYVRLFNKTDKHPVWFSEVSLEGGTPQLLISNPITLDYGNKLYQVQMKTSLKFQAILDQSRVRITTN